jgi:hypothetical protein
MLFILDSKPKEERTHVATHDLGLAIRRRRRLLRCRFLLLPFNLELFSLRELTLKSRIDDPGLFPAASKGR